MSHLILVLLLVVSCFMTINSFHISRIPSMKPPSRLTMKSNAVSDFNIPSFASKLLVAGALTLSSMPLAPALAAINGYYLTEPTSSFVDEEKRSQALRKQQLAVRQNWDALIEEFTNAPNPPKREESLVKLKKLLKSIDTLPTGVKKQDLVKTCRAQKFNGKKVKPEWTKEVEIAYQSLIQEWNRQANPKNPGDKTI